MMFQTEIFRHVLSVVLVAISLHGVRAQGGVEAWNEALALDPNSSPGLSVDGATVYIGTGTNEYLHAFSVADGTSVWSVHLNGDVGSKPVQSGSSVFIGTEASDNSMYALDIADGSIQWRKETGSYVRGTPALSSDGSSMFFGSLDTYVYMVSTSDGGEIDKYATIESISCGPLLSADDSMLFAVNGNLGVGSDVTSGYLYAFSVTESGLSLAWQYSTDGVNGGNGYGATHDEPDFPGVLSLDDATLYFAPDNKLVALDTATGNEMWTHSVDGDWANPILSPNGSVLYVGHTDGVLYAIDAGSGTTLWTFDTGTAITGTATLSEDGMLLYVGSDKMYAIDTSTHAPIWDFTADDIIARGSVLSLDGSTLIFVEGYAHTSSHIYAVSTGWMLATTSTTSSTSSTTSSTSSSTTSSSTTSSSTTSSTSSTSTSSTSSTSTSSTSTTSSSSTSTTVPFAYDCHQRVCYGLCDSLVGNGECDSDDSSLFDLNCETFNYDGGDCALDPFALFPWLMWVIVAVAAFAFIVIVAVVALVCRKRRTHKHSQNQSQAELTCHHRPQQQQVVVAQHAHAHVAQFDVQIAEPVQAYEIGHN